MCLAPSNYTPLPNSMHYQVSQAVSSLKISDQIFVWISHLPQSCYTSCQSYTLLLDHPNNIVFFNHGTTALEGQGLLIVEGSWSHSDTPHSVGLLWTSDQPDTETSTWQHTTLTWETYKPLAGFEPTIPAREVILYGENKLRRSSLLVLHSLFSPVILTEIWVSVNFVTQNSKVQCQY